MTDLERIEKKLDRVLEYAPLLDAIGELIIPRSIVTERMDLNKNTVSQHPGEKEIGRRRTFIEIGELSTIRRRKRSKKRPQSSAK